MDTSQRTVIVEAISADNIDENEDQQDHHFNSSTPLILDPSTISISDADSEVLNSQNGGATMAVACTESGTAGTFTIGSHMYIIQSDNNHSGEESLHHHAFVLQPAGESDSKGSLNQGKTITIQNAEEDCVIGDNREMMSRVDFAAQPVTAEDDSQDDSHYQSLQESQEGMASVISAAAMGNGDQGETITISLEEATQIILQQQGLEGAAIQMSDGSYQLLGQQFIQVTKEDGTLDAHALPVEVVHALSAGMVSYSSIDTVKTHEGADSDTGLSATQVDIDGNYDAGSHETEVKPTHVASEVAAKDYSVIIKQEVDANTDILISEQTGIPTQFQKKSAVRIPKLAVSITASGATTAVLEAKPGSSVIQRQVVNPKPDLNCPIEVTERTEVMIRGKKCVLMQNPETKQLCAYPILPPEGKKRRGRPRKVRPDKPDETVKLQLDNTYTAPAVETTTGPGVCKEERLRIPATEQASIAGDTDVTYGDQNSAAEGLLELSNAGPDSLRRSGRKRKKAKVFEDYDILEASSDEEGNFNDDEKDPDVTLYGVKKQKIKREPVPFNPFMMPLKRGRGRPRRYPPPGQSSSTASIPAVILPSPNGQTIVMAPLQGLQNIPGLQSHMKTQLQQLMPKLSITKNGEAALSAAVQTSTTATALGSEGDALPIDPSAVLDGNGVLSSGLPGDSLIPGGESSDTQEGLDAVGEKEQNEGESGLSSDSRPHTVIQIPDNLLPMLGIKKDPIKIGLKASESDLVKLKCPKCDFQAYYIQQYQNHIATHAADIQKCKCCNYLTFDKDDLLQHFKDSHPRCICDVCEFMAEHAYMIKRHMMRHNAEGCTCDVCGKIYKDQYILKMHVKMVHMPAEVLFECRVCGKKFTRKAHLKRHLRIHDPEKPFKCPHCDYRGCERSDISKHLLIHEEPRHVCDVCGKAFRHIKNKELHVKRHNGQKDYKCGVCDFYGYTFTDIRKHIERKHSDIKTVACDKCSIPFKSEMQLREHQKDNCEVLMIEQALAIDTSNGGTSQATIQIPSSFAVDGQQITIDGQQIAVDGGHVNITVEHVPEEDMSLEDQMVETTISDIVTSSSHVMDSTDQSVMVNSSIHIIPHEDIEEGVDLPNERMVHLE